jgi:CheY-like chemotaxis protein
MKQLHRILIIDDDAITCFLQKRILQDMNIAEEIDYITDAPEALQHITERYVLKKEENAPGPHLILLDLDMPKMSGLQVMEALERLPLDRNKLFIVILTASISPEDKKQAEQKNLSLDGYYAKPITKSIMDELLSLIAQKQSKH